MKRLLSVTILLLGLFIPAHADSKISWDFGTLKLYLPFQTVNGVGLWDFVQKRGMAGAETPVGAWKRFEFRAGAVTSLNGRGAPFVSADYTFISPAENFIPLASFHPGFFAGYDFNAAPGTHPWILGLKASVEFFTLGDN